jgi:nicotinamide-nucleotide amidase
VATTGVAGPGGGTQEKPVGTIWLAAVGPGLRTAKRLQFPFDRRKNKIVSTYSALDVVRRHLRERGR